MAKRDRQQSLFREALPLTLRKGDIRKIQIIDAAIASLATDGLRKLTYQTVANHSKLAVAHIAYHFPQLDDLLLAAIKYVYASLHSHITDALVTEPPPGEILQVYLDAHLEWLQVNPRYPSAGLSLINLACSDTRFRALHTELKVLGEKRIETLLQLTAKARGKKVPAAKLRDVAHHLQSLLMGQIVFFQSIEHARTIAVLKKSIHQQAIAMLDGI